MRQKLVQTEADKTHAWKAVESMFQIKKGKKPSKSNNQRRRSPFKKDSAKLSNSIEPHAGYYGKSSPSLETAENITIPKKSTSAELLRSDASSSSLVD